MHAIHKQLGTLIRSLARLPLVTIVEAIANFRQKGAADRGEPKVYPTTFELGCGHRVHCFAVVQRPQEALNHKPAGDVERDRFVAAVFNLEQQVDLFLRKRGGKFHACAHPIQCPMVRAILNGC